VASRPAADRHDRDARLRPVFPDEGDAATVGGKGGSAFVGRAAGEAARQLAAALFEVQVEGGAGRRAPRKDDPLSPRRERGVNFFAGLAGEGHGAQRLGRRTRRARRPGKRAGCRQGHGGQREGPALPRAGRRRKRLWDRDARGRGRLLAFPLRRRGPLAHGGDEAIALRADRLDVLGASRVVVEGLAQRGDAAQERVVGDDGVAPYLFHELLFGDDLPGPLGEALKHLHHLGLHARLSVFTRDAPSAHVDPVAPHLEEWALPFFRRVFGGGVPHEKRNFMVERFSTTAALGRRSVALTPLLRLPPTTTHAPRPAADARHRYARHRSRSVPRPREPWPRAQ